MGILSFLGLVFIIVIIAFVWQTYVKGDVDFKTQHYKKSPINSLKSLQDIALQLGCRPSDAMQAYHEALAEKTMQSGYSREEATSMLKYSIAELEMQQLKQAAISKINPEDTPAALMKEWSIAFIDILRKG